MAMDISFALESEGSNSWLCHGGQRVMLIPSVADGLNYADPVFLRQPGPHPVRCPESYHFPTAIGAQLRFVWRYAAPDWLPMELRKATCGDKAVLVFAKRTKDGRAEQAVTLTLRADKAGRYFLRIKTRLTAPENQRVEFLNFYPGGMGNSWADQKRFTDTVQEVSPGVFKRRSHSHLSVMEIDMWGTDLQEPRISPEPSKKYAESHALKPLCAGGTLFFYGQVVTPALRLISTSAPVTTDACDMWFDEHVTIDHGTPQADGRYRYEAQFDIFRLDQQQADQAISAAGEFDYSPATDSHEFPAFYCDRVNRFTAPAGRYYDGEAGVYYAFEDPRQILSWDRKGGPDGGGAIVLNTVDWAKPTTGQAYQSVSVEEGDCPRVRAIPLGFAIHLIKGQAVEFSARVRAQGGAAAFLEMREGPYGHAMSEGSHGTRLDVPSGQGDWQRVSGRLISRLPNGLAAIYLGCEGKGRAMFSELLLTRVQP